MVLSAAPPIAATWEIQSVQPGESQSQTHGVPPAFMEPCAVLVIKESLLETLLIIFFTSEIKQQIWCQFKEKVLKPFISGHTNSPHNLRSILFDIESVPFRVTPVHQIVPLCFYILHDKEFATCVSFRYMDGC
jgi:hypothetical protein